MKNALTLLALAAVLPCAAVEWKNMDEARWYSGPKLTQEFLAGKVVMVDEWGVNCPPCRALLPEMQKYWSAFKTKNFVLVGSHRQGRAEDKVAELVKANKLSYPIYDGFGLAAGEPANGGGIPFIYVVNHRGKVVYSGRSAKEAIAAAEDAIVAADLPPSLTGDLSFGKKSPYRNIDRQLVLGKPVATVVRKLESDVKRASLKSATPAQKAAAEEARQILDALEEAKREIPAEIEAKLATDPSEAVKYAKLFIKSFPKDSDAVKEKLPSMLEAEKEWKAAHKPGAAAK